MRNTAIISAILCSGLLHGQSATKGSSSMLAAHYEESSRMSTAHSMKPAPNGASTSSIRVSTGVVGPTLISEPAFTLSEAEFGRQNLGFEHMIVSFRVDEKGKPHHVHVLKPVNPSVDEHVIDAVRHYRFAPATLDNQKIAVYIKMTVNFERR